MKHVASCLLLICCALPAQADEISADTRGTWTASGACTDAKRILIGTDTVTLVSANKKQVLKDGDESVWNGTRIVNAARSGKNETADAIAFSAQIIERDGEPILQTKDLGEREKDFQGDYKRCKEQTQTAAQAKPKPVRRAANERAPERPPRTAPPAVSRWPGTLLGGLY